MAAARNALGIIALKNGDAAQAEREIRSAIDLKADVRLAVLEANGQNSLFPAADGAESADGSGGSEERPPVG